MILISRYVWPFRLHEFVADLYEFQKIEALMTSSQFAKLKLAEFNPRKTNSTKTNSTKTSSTREKY